MKKKLLSFFAHAVYGADAAALGALPGILRKEVNTY